MSQANQRSDEIYCTGFTGEGLSFEYKTEMLGYLDIFSNFYSNKIYSFGNNFFNNYSSVVSPWGI